MLDGKPHLYVGTPGWKLAPHHRLSTDALLLAGREHGYHVTLMGPQTGLGIDMARSCMAEEFLEDKTGDALLFIDGDIGFSATDVHNMLLLIGTGEVDIVGGAYPKKTINWTQVANAARAGVPDNELPAYACDFVWNMPLGSNGVPEARFVHGHRLAPVEQLGTGFLMVSRRAFEKFAAFYGPELEYMANYEPYVGKTHRLFFHHQRDPRSERMLAEAALLTGIREGELDFEAADRYKRACDDPKSIGVVLSEDFAFCTKAKMAGIQTWCFLDAWLSHQGPYVFQGHVGKFFKTEPNHPLKPADGFRFPDNTCGAWEDVFGGDYWAPNIEPHVLGPAPTILDVGANVGVFCLWAAERWPGAQLWAWEPHPDNYEKLVHNTQRIAVRGHAAAVSDHAGMKLLHNGAWGIAGNNSFFNIGQQEEDGTTVEVVPASTLPPCDFLKVDTEGCEPEIIGTYPHLAGCKVVAFEWHRLEDKVSLAQLLLNKGFRCAHDREWAKGQRGVLTFMKPELLENRKAAE